MVVVRSAKHLGSGIGFRGKRLSAWYRGGSTGKLLAAIATAVISVPAAAPAQVATYDTSADTAANSIATSKSATSSAVGVTASTITRTTLTAPASGTAGFFTSTTPNVTATLALTTNYFGFTVTPAAGNAIFATSFNWSTQGSSTAPNNYAIAYSTDAFATSTSNTYTGTNVTTAVARSYDITDLITNDVLAVRLYNYGTTAIGGGTSAATGTFSIATPTVGGSAFTTAASPIVLAANTEIRDANALTLGGNISGAFTITKTGVGTLTLSGTNTQTGGTTISAGTPLYASPGAIAGSTANVTVSAGGTTIAGYGLDQAFISRIATGSAGTVAINANTSANLDFTGKTALNLGATGSFTYSGTLTPNSSTFRLGGG